MPAPVSLTDTLRQFFGHHEFRGSQRAIVERTLDGRHSLVIMPTGMGKSLCYQLPAIYFAQQANNTSPGDQQSNANRSLTLVLSPLIALMQDQVQSLRAKNIDASFINSSLDRNQRESRYADVREGKYDLLYVTPERFRKTDFCEVLATREVKLLAVDEAHCISEWGHDFRPDYTRLAEIREQLGEPTTIALTATATPDVQQDIIKQLGLAAADVEMFHEGIDRPNLELTVVPVWDESDKLEQILSVQDEMGGSGIVYFTLIKTLEHYSELLRQKSIGHLVYHGELDRVRRRTLQERFMTRPDQLVLATNAFGMGIDKEDIRFVIHADVPGSMESYYQEIGRAGRDGLPSKCVLLYHSDDLATQAEFMRWSNPDAEFYERVHYHLRHDREQVQAFGLEWLREKLHAKQKFDRRLETALAMLDRYGILDGQLEPLEIRGVGELPPQLRDADRLSEKLLRDQKKLYALVEYVQHEGDRKAFIHRYFGIPYHSDDPSPA